MYNSSKAMRWNIKNLTKDQKKLRMRILDISFRDKASHIGSCLSCVDLIDAIYQVKKKNDKFVLSNGHAGVALYTILEKNKLLKNPNLNDFHVHPDRNIKIGIDVSTGSLGQGLPIALGLALANRKNNVFCILSDGECTQGSIWEALRVAQEQKLGNLTILINANGWGAYDPISIPILIKRLKGFTHELKIINGHKIKDIIKALENKKNIPNVIFALTTSDQLPFLKGQDAHYYVMKDEDYKISKEYLSE